ncbi:TPA: hypothetical protein ACOFBV_001275 [Stenotrophomonas maltophilia]|uniref:hypothetical protein n=1 Tax=Stenotrophomonas maltophilia TaxID=40324 RepID=UPI0039C15FEF
MANPYQAGQTLGDALFGSTQDTYTNQLGRTYQVEQALQEARRARSRAVMANQNATSRQGITADLIGRARAGDVAALNELTALGLTANETMSFDALGKTQEFGFRQAARDKAVLGDPLNPNSELFGIAKGPVETTKISDGVAYSPLGSSSQAVNVTPLGEASIGQRRAAAAASWASAGNSNASAVRTRQGMALDRADVLGSGSSAGRGGKAPSGYRWNAAGNLEAIPGGPADKPQGGAASLPVGALKELLGVEEALGATEVLGDIIGKNRNRLTNGTLDVGPGARIAGRIRTGLNMSNANDVNITELNADKTKIVNESLRLNKGVHTEGDAIRAGEELMAANDAATLKRAFDRLEEINQRAIQLQRRKEGLINSNYGRESTLGDPEMMAPAPVRPGLPAATGARRRYNPATGRIE